MPTGLLLPSSTLTTPWFIVLATIVAFNTIIYLGLTVSKLVPWPPQIHPSKVRAILARDANEPIAPEKVPMPERPETDDPYDLMRRNIARETLPQAFGLLGGLIIIATVVNVILTPSGNAVQYAIQFIVGLAFIASTQILGRRPFRAFTIMWTWAVAGILLAAVLVGEMLVNDNAFAINYVLLLLVVIPPAGMAWRPAMVADLVIAAILIGGLATMDAATLVRGVVSALVAMLAGALLLHLRLSAIDGLAEEQLKANALATTDPLTGVLSRHGLMTLAPRVSATANRVDEEVCVMVFNITNLGQANTEYGLRYGDEVIRAVAEAIEETVREGDMVARWGGDEFLVLGIGGRPDAQSLAQRIQRAVETTGVALGKWPTTVSVGTAAGYPNETTMEALVEQADRDRHEARGSLAE
jgi:diguanylate cyclase (GGDEF)-like protein